MKLRVACEKRSQNEIVNCKIFLFFTPLSASLLLKVWFLFLLYLNVQTFGEALDFCFDGSNEGRKNLKSTSHDQLNVCKKLYLDIQSFKLYNLIAILVRLCKTCLLSTKLCASYYQRSLLVFCDLFIP